MTQWLGDLVRRLASVDDGHASPRRGRHPVGLALALIALVLLAATEMWLWRASVYLADPTAIEVDSEVDAFIDKVSALRPGADDRASSTVLPRRGMVEEPRPADPSSAQR
jgi:hypothetical protein